MVALNITSLKNIKKEIEAIIDPKDITIALAAENISSPWSDKYNVDYWIVNIKGQVFHYCTGLGHRINTNYNTAKKKAAEQFTTTLIAKQITQPSQSRYCLNREYMFIPTTADVLYHLIMDGLGAQENFSNWCSDFGYSNDSIKAFNTYTKCTEIFEQLLKVLSRKDIEKISKLLEDY